jgi:hypothetical protein
MSQADESRLEPKVGSQHQGGRPYHFCAPDQEARIREVFAIRENAPLPAASDRTLATYYDYLAAHLALPFEALYCQPSGPMRQLIHYVRVLELTDPRQGRTWNVLGLSCKVRTVKAVVEMPLDELGVREDSPNCQLLDDYAYWFVNYR